MRPKLPTLGEPPRKSPIGKVLGIALVAGLAAGGYHYWKTREPLPVLGVKLRGDAPADAAAGAQAPPPIATNGAAAPAPGAAGAVPPPIAVAPGVDGGAGAPPIAQAAAPATPADKLAQAGLQRAQVVIDGPLESAMVAAVGKAVGAPLTQVVNRALVWWITVPNDLRRGDALDVLYQERPGEEPLVHAVRFVSSKTGRTHRAYRFKGEGESHRMFDPNGEELELRLEDSPIDEYEQITSLIRDGRRHKGVDFKAKVGTPVKAPFDGRITRKNWNWRVNGNCLELRASSGQQVALFLHLAELSGNLKPGDVVKKGQVLAESGNTGRSFAPHLHYQLESISGRVLDPFDFHRTYRRKLPAPAVPAFTAEVERLDALMTTAVAGVAATP